MATLFKKTYTAPIPEEAEIFTRKGIEFARYKGRDGKNRTERLTSDGSRLLLETQTWYAYITLADGGYDKINTKCKDKATAEQFAISLQTEQDKIRAGVFSKKEVKAAKHGRDSLQKTVEAYLSSMTARGKAVTTVKEFRRYLEVTCKALGWKTVKDIDKVSIDAYLEDQRRNGRGARSCNAYAVTWVAFGNWLMATDRTGINPVSGLVRFDERADRRHQRRAFTLPELELLFKTAEERPLKERLTNRGSKAKLTPATIDKLKWLGRTRAIAYRTLAYTGLRWSELRSITIGTAFLDAEPAFLLLQSENEKNSKGSRIPLHADLRVALMEYREDRIKRLAGDCTAFPGAFDHEPFFDELPVKMSKVFNQDLEAAGISKKDGAERVLDVHALRTTFGTMLARAGVGITTAQRLMRHSTPALTANVYTVLELTDTEQAVNALPKMESIREEKKVSSGE